MRPRPALGRLAAAHALVAAALSAAACGGANPNVAATVNGDVISIAEAQRRASAAPPQEGADPAAPPELAALNELILARLVSQGASELDVVISEESLTAERAGLVESQGGQEAYDQLLAEQGLTAADNDEQLRLGLLFEAVTAALTADIEVSADEVEAVYDEQYGGEAVYPRAIVVASREDAEDVIARVTQGEDFGEIIRTESIDQQTAAQGGELGAIRPGDAVGPVGDALAGLEAGELTEPIELQPGAWAVLEVLEPPSLDDVGPGIAEQLRQSEERGVVEQWLSDQGSQADVTVNPRFGRWDPAAAQVVAADPLGEVAPASPADGAGAVPSAPATPAP